MRYSTQGGIQKNTDASKVEEIHYRLRHLNTGRLVINQEISFNGISLLTLGLSPHIQYKNLSDYSEQGIENIQGDMMKLDQADQFVQYNKDGTQIIESE